MKKLGAWEVALLVLSVAIAALYLAVARGAEGTFENDAAYYFGVARHIVLTGKLEEPIVWQFQHPPDTLLHAPFDFWGGLTSLYLVPVFEVFGPSEHTAFLAMAAVSGASVIAFAYLVAVALPVRYPALQLFALLAFAFSASARDYRFDTESIPLFHLGLLLALIGVTTRRPGLAVASAFALVLCRVDGLLAFACVTFVVAFPMRATRASRVRALLLAASLFGAYVARNAWSFHTVLPPGSASAALLPDQRSLYLVHARPTTLAATLGGRFALPYLTARVALLRTCLSSIPFLPAPRLAYGLALLGPLGLVRACGRRLAWMPVVALGAAVLLVWASGPMFHDWRTLSEILPLIVLAPVSGASVAFDVVALVSLRIRGRHRAWTEGATALLVFAVVLFAAGIDPYGPRERAVGSDFENELRALDPLLGGAPVASTSPWQVIAQTRSPAVSLPYDGEAAVAEVVHRYGVRWIVIAHRYAVLRTALKPLPVGGRARVGDVVVERVPFAGETHVFRIVEDAPAAT